MLATKARDGEKNFKVGKICKVSEKRLSFLYNEMKQRGKRNLAEDVLNIICNGKKRA